MSKALTYASLREGVRELSARDKTLSAIASRLGVPPLWARRPGFPTLVHIILEQQVSIGAARTLFQRLKRHVGVVSARSIHAMGEQGLREFGLTRQKARYCHGLAELILDGKLDLSKVAASTEALGRSMLLAVTGLGPWSIDIYYLMALRRPDVWPEGDLALATALRDVKHLVRLPAREEQRKIASHWSPWRSVAARLLWAHYLSARGLYTPSSPVLLP
jgi:DNA-3-methyladenine glycosylase II